MSCMDVQVRVDRPSHLCPQRGYLPIWWCPTWMMIDGSEAIEPRIWTHKLLLIFCGQGHIQCEWGSGNKMASLVLHKCFVFSLHSYKAVILPTIRSLKCTHSCHSECYSCRENAATDAEIKEVKRQLQHHTVSPLSRCQPSVVSQVLRCLSSAHLFHYNF